MLGRAMELEVERRKLVGRPKKRWIKVVGEEKLKNTEEKKRKAKQHRRYMAEDRKQWRQLI